MCTDDGPRRIDMSRENVTVVLDSM